MPNFTLPKARLVFERDRPAMPLPENVDCCGLVAALSKISQCRAMCADRVRRERHSKCAICLRRERDRNRAASSMPLSVYSAGSDDIAFEMISGLVAPVFLTVRFFVTVWPTGTLLNDSDAVTDIEVVGVEVGVAVAVGVAAAV